MTTRANELPRRPPVPCGHPRPWSVSDRQEPHMFDSWIEALGAVAERHRGRTAFTVVDEAGLGAERISFGELEHRARTVAARLRARGLAGRPVLVLLPTGLDYLGAVLGCLFAGAIAVPLYVPSASRRSANRLRSVVRDCGANAAFVTSAMLPRLRATVEDELSLDLIAIDAADPGGTVGDGWADPEVRAEHPAILQYTSGSTAAPKGVVLTHGNLLHNCGLIQHAFASDEHTRAVSWLPLYHDMGLIGGVLEPLYCAAEVTLMSPTAFARDPLRWLREVSRTRATVSGGPNFAYELCAARATPDDVAALDLSEWRVAFNGAEPVRAATLERFAEVFAPAGFAPTAATPCYGLAEASLMVACTEIGREPATARFSRASIGRGRPAPGDGTDDVSLVSSGPPCADQEVAIVDPDTATRRPDGTVGEIWVSGRSVARGYRGRPESGAQTFRARLPGRDADFLRTGDLGFLVDGQLFVSGRRKDMIIVAGHNIYPQDVEESVQAALGDTTAACAAFTIDRDGVERLAVVAEVHRHVPADRLAGLAAEIRDAIGESHEVGPAAVILVRAGAIPRTTSGKVQRGQCRADLAAGTLPVRFDDRTVRVTTHAGTEIPGDVDPAIHAAVATALGRPQEILPAHVPLVALDLDSIAAMQLGYALSRAYGFDGGVHDLLRATLAELTAALADPSRAPAVANPAVANPAVANPAVTGDPATATGDHELSHTQRGMYFLHHLDPSSTAYVISGAAVVHGDLHVAALSGSLRDLVHRHPALRTTFPASGGAPVRRVHDDLAIDVEVDTAAPGGTHRPFDLATGPLLRIHVAREPGRTVLALSVHHMIADIWALGVLLREWAALYAAACGGPAADLPPVTYPHDWSVTRQRLAAGDDRLVDFWGEALKDPPAPLALPTDRSPERLGSAGAAVDATVAAAVADRLRRLAADRRVTLHSLLLTAYGVLLHRHTGRSDLVVGAPMHGRTEAVAVDAVDCLVNTVAIRVRIDPEETFGTLLDRVEATVRAASRHGELPFEAVVERFGDIDRARRAPLVQTLFTTYHVSDPWSAALGAAAVGHAGARVPFGDLTLEPLPVPVVDTQFDLVLSAAAVGDALGLRMRYRADVFAPVTARRLIDQLTAMLAGLAADVPVHALDGVPPDQVAAEADELLGPPVAVEGPLVPVQSDRWVAETPDAIAVGWDGPDGTPRTMTYADLHARVERLARRLRDNGVRPEQPVGVYLSRTGDLPVAVLAIMRAGGIVLPLDVGVPPERTRRMLADAGARLVLTNGTTHATLPAGTWSTVDVNATGDGRLPTSYDGANAAYLIFTSGSTGRPKAAVLTHANLRHFLDGLTAVAPLRPGDVWMAIATGTFDLSICEMLAPLRHGATCHIVGRDIAVDGAALRDRLDDPRITHLLATPGTWRLLLDAGWSSRPGLTLMSGGDLLPGAVANALTDGGATMINAYGPSETTVVTNAARLVPPIDRPAVPLGRTLPGTHLHLTDPAGRRVPPGAIGEVRIGGPAVARGYLGRPGLTAERFVPDPYGRPGARAYRSGDLARLGPSGGIDFHGRVDHQVKIRGYRVEPGEIEVALAAHPAVAHAVVLVAGDGVDARLVAHVVIRSATTEDDLRAHLVALLPGHMVPRQWIRHEALPISARGKIDRATLGRDTPDGTGHHVPPATETERWLAVLIGELLGVERVGRHDDFFELGGHSLFLSRLRLAMVDRCHVDVGLPLLYAQPTVAQVAGAVDALAGADTGGGPTRITRVDRRAYALDASGGPAR